MSTQTPTRNGTVLLTPADAARVANVSRDTIYREIERGVLPVRHVGRQLRIDPDDFRHYLARSCRSCRPASVEQLAGTSVPSSARERTRRPRSRTTKAQIPTQTLELRRDCVGA
jgi:excisionase family DNA binding protein